MFLRERESRKGHNYICHDACVRMSLSGAPIQVTCGGDHVDEMLDVTRRLLGLQVS